MGMILGTATKWGFALFAAYMPIWRISQLLAWCFEERTWGANCFFKSRPEA
jgi:hypothetical protein